MILFRCLAGIFAGSVVTVRAMLTENSTKETQARVFSYFAFAGNIGGIFVGPLLGKFHSHLTYITSNLTSCRWRLGTTSFEVSFRL